MPVGTWGPGSQENGGTDGEPQVLQARRNEGGPDNHSDNTSKKEEREEDHKTIAVFGSTWKKSKRLLEGRNVLGAF